MMASPYTLGYDWIRRNKDLLRGFWITLAIGIVATVAMVRMIALIRLLPLEIQDYLIGILVVITCGTVFWLDKNVSTAWGFWVAGLAAFVAFACYVGGLACFWPAAYVAMAFAWLGDDDPCYWGIVVASALLVAPATLLFLGYGAVTLWHYL